MEWPPTQEPERPGWLEPPDPEPHGTRTRLRFAMAICGAIVGLLAAAGLASGLGDRDDGGMLGGSSAAAAPAELKILIDRQWTLTREQRWAELYGTLSPQLRASCTFEEFLADFQTAPPDGWTLVGYQNLEAVVDGDVARATYEITYDDELVGVVTAANPDLYERVDGRWYDAPDEHTACQTEN